MKKMERTIKRLYEKTGDETVVIKAYEKGWISEEQKNRILGL